MNAYIPIISRADLLRVANSSDKQMDLAAVLLGYQKQKPDKKSNKPQQEDLPENQDEDNSANTESRGKLNKVQRPAEQFYYRSSYQQHNNQNDQESGIPSAIQGVKAFQKGELQADKTVLAPVSLPLAPPARLQPFLQKTLTQQQRRCLDIVALIKKVSQLKPLNTLPKKHKRIPAARVCVVMDLNSRVLPFWDDFHRLVESIIKKQGKLGLDIRVIEDTAAGNYRDYIQSQLSKKNVYKQWRMPEPHTVVLILSDLGLLSEHKIIQQRWLRLGKQIKQQGLQCPIVLSPISPEQQNRSLQGVFKQIIWDKNSRFIENTAASYNPNRKEYMETLLMLVSPALHVEPELLRAISYLLPANQADAGIEAQIWQHKHIIFGYTAFVIQPGARLNYQQKFATEVSPHVQKQVLQRIKQYHQGQFPSIWAEEVLQANAIVSFPMNEVEPDIKKQRQLLQRFTRSFYEQQDNSLMLQYAHRYLPRQSDAVITDNKHSSVMFAVANKQALSTGELAIPTAYDVSQVQAVISTSIATRAYYLIQQGQMITLQQQLTPQQKQLTKAHVEFARLKVTRDKIQVNINHQGFKSLTIDAEQAEVQIASLPLNTLEIETGAERLRIDCLKKPHWANSIKADQHHAIVLGTAMQKTVEYHWALSLVSQPEKQQIRWRLQEQDCFKLPEGVSTFSCDEYGMYIDVKIQKITQRFRWINAGVFLMGSPNNEKGRYSRETQHKVTLTKGYWMADTVCTQAMWQAVTKKQPSHFEGNNRPVERVSWDDIQVFIEKLHTLMPQLLARLPSEAEWEYACRAGTTGAFNVADELNAVNVNYRGTWEYDSNRWGKYAKKATVEVKTMKNPNMWGLHEMHGNVWEWCQDAYQEYKVENATDPLVTKGDYRMFRGGSWGGGGRSLRSAYRGCWRPDDRDDDLGFRLVLGLELQASKEQFISQTSGKQAEQRAAGLGDKLRKGIGKLWGKNR